MQIFTQWSQTNFTLSQSYPDFLPGSQSKRSWSSTQIWVGNESYLHNCFRRAKKGIQTIVLHAVGWVSQSEGATWMKWVTHTSGIFQVKNNLAGRIKTTRGMTTAAWPFELDGKIGKFGTPPHKTDDASERKSNKRTKPGGIGEKNAN